MNKYCQTRELRNIRCDFSHIGKKISIVDCFAVNWRTNTALLSELDSKNVILERKICHDIRSKSEQDFTFNIQRQKADDVRGHPPRIMIDFPNPSLYSDSARKALASSRYKGVLDLLSTLTKKRKIASNEDSGEDSDEDSAVPSRAPLLSAPTPTAVLPGTPSPARLLLSAPPIPHTGSHGTRSRALLLFAPPTPPAGSGTPSPAPLPHLQ